MVASESLSARAKEERKEEGKQKTKKRRRETRGVCNRALLVPRPVWPGGKYRLSEKMPGSRQPD